MWIIQNYNWTSTCISNSMPHCCFVCQQFVALLSMTMLWEHFVKCFQSLQNSNITLQKNLIALELLCLYLRVTSPQVINWALLMQHPVVINSQHCLWQTVTCKERMVSDADASSKVDSHCWICLTTPPLHCPPHSHAVATPTPKTKNCVFRVREPYFCHNYVLISVNNEFMDWPVATLHMCQNQSQYCNNRLPTQIFITMYMPSIAHPKFYPWLKFGKHFEEIQISKFLK